MKVKRKENILYILAYFVVVFSALAFFKQNWFRVFIILFTVYLFVKFNLQIDKRLFYVILFFIYILTSQALKWRGSMFLSIGSIVYFAIIPYLFLKILGLNFPKYIVKIIYYYSIISLIFWTLTNVVPGFYGFTKGLAASLGTHPIDYTKTFHGTPEQFILYTYEPAHIFGLVRNPGPFHEPGAFAVFLIFAIIFNIIISHKLMNKVNYVLIAALITTFSTAGILALMILLAFYPLVRSKKYKGLSILFVSVFIPLLVFFYFKIDFLNEKISGQYEHAQNVSLNTPVVSRFLGLRKSIYVLSKYPFTGRGLLSITAAGRFSPEAATYGFMSFGARIGLVGLLIYLYVFYKAILNYCLYYNYNKSFAIAAFIAFLFVLFAQSYAEAPLFMMIFFSYFIFGDFGKRRKMNKYVKLKGIR